MDLQSVSIKYLFDFIQSGLFHVLERAPRRLLKVWQFLLFKKFYRLAFKNTQFYQQLYQKKGLTSDSIKTVSDICRIPVIYKKDIQNFPESAFLNSKIDYSRFYRRKTSGSTGQPIEFVRDRKYLPQTKAFYYLNYKWFGVSTDTPRVCLKSPDGSKRFWESENTLYVYFNDFQNNIEKYVNKIESFKPISIEAHPSYLVFLASALREAGKKLCVPLVISYGEQMLEEDRRLLKETFDAEVTSFYGLNEVGDLGIECELHNGFHINEANFLVEIVDETGRPVSGADEGDIIVTSFINEAAPLIRYNTGDRGRWISEPCSCGRTWRRIRLLGRKNDTLITPEGKIIFSFYFNPIFDAYIDEIKQYQLIQRATDTFLLTVVPSALFKEETEVKLIGSLKSLLGTKAKITLKKVELIPWGKSGKRKFIINEI